MNKKEITCYEIDASQIQGRAEKVLFPTDIEEIQKIIRTSHLDLVPRGGGTNLVGGCVPNNSIIVDMKKMHKIIEFDKNHSTIFVEAGITLDELNEILDYNGFEFPIQINNLTATIGGMVATNASGFWDMKYGRMKNWIESIDIINGKSEIQKIGKSDLGDFCGMEGITGIITRIKLKLIPKTKKSASIFQTNNLDDVLKIARRLKSETDVIMIELFSKDISEMLGLSYKYHLLIEFIGDRGKIKEEKYKKIIALKEKIYFALGEKNLNYDFDPKLFFDRINDFLIYLENRGIHYFGFLGSGIIHPLFKDHEELKKKETNNIIKKMGGKLGKFGIGLTKKDYLDNFEKKIAHRIKKRYDPMMKLNKGKICDFEDIVQEVSHYVQEDIKVNQSINTKPSIKENFKNKEPIKEIIVVEKSEDKIMSINDARLTTNSTNKKESDLISQVMGNSLTKNNENKTQEINPPEIDNNNQIEKRGKLSKEDQDLINKIMTGRFGMKNNGDKKDEH